MEFTSNQYTGEDFRKEQHLFIKFYDGEVSTALGTKCSIEYFYRKLENGKYQMVEIDPVDNKLYCHNECFTVQGFADDVITDTYARESTGYIDEEVLSLYPDDIKQHESYLASYYTKGIVALIHSALDEGDRPLVKALLLDFNEIRSKFNPAPYIPGISKREIEKKKELLRKYYRSRGFKEIHQDRFVSQTGSSRRVANLEKYELYCIGSNAYGGGGRRTRYEDMKESELDRYSY